MWNIWTILLLMIGLGLLIALAMALSGGKLPYIKKHQVATLVIALVALFLAFALITGVINVKTSVTTPVNTQQTTDYTVTYVLGNIQGASAASNTATSVILASKMVTINGVNGIETTANTYNGGNFVVAGDHNATVGQAQFAITLYRTDLITGNMSFSISAVGIPTITNATSAKSYPLVVQTSSNQYEVYFDNNTQIPNMYVHTIAMGGQITIWVTINYNSNAVDSMTVYQSEIFNLNINYGTGQSLSIPVELIRAS